MKRTLIRYKTKPELADRNAELIAGVFEELKAAKLEGVRYFQSGIRERCIEPPLAQGATIVGNYRMLEVP